MDTPKYKRVLVKLSGEALMAGGNEIIDKEFLKTICTTIKKCTDMGTQVAIVVGAGNIWRGGRADKKIPKLGGGKGSAFHKKGKQFIGACTDHGRDSKEEGEFRRRLSRHTKQ